MHRCTQADRLVLICSWCSGDVWCVFPFMQWSISSEEEVGEEGTLLVAALPGGGVQQRKEEDADSAVESELEVCGAFTVGTAKHLCESFASLTVMFLLHPSILLPSSLALLPPPPLHPSPISSLPLIPSYTHQSQSSFEEEHWLRSHIQAPYWIDSLNTTEMRLVGTHKCMV